MIVAIVFFIGGLMIGYAASRFVRDERLHRKMVECEQVIAEYNSKMELFDWLEREVAELRAEISKL